VSTPAEYLLSVVVVGCSRRLRQSRFWDRLGGRLRISACGCRYSLRLTRLVAGTIRRCLAGRLRRRPVPLVADDLDQQHPGVGGCGDDGAHHTGNLSGTAVKATAVVVVIGTTSYEISCTFTPSKARAVHQACAEVLRTFKVS
jgi:hypothetical protein